MGERYIFTAFYKSTKSNKGVFKYIKIGRFGYVWNKIKLRPYKVLISGTWWMK